MTEPEWRTSDEPITLLCGLQGRITSRKYHLFEVASARQFVPAAGSELVTRWLDHVEAVAEQRPGDEAEGDRLSDAITTLAEQTGAEARRLFEAVGDPDAAAVRSAMARYVAVSRANGTLGSMEWWFWLGDMRPAGPPTTYSDYLDRRTLATYRETLPLLRCVVGNPFRPVAVEPGWRTSAVVGLATTIYADRAWDRLPVLADALEDAGCTNAEVIGHCRGPGPHARGCWVVDLVLGKA